MSAGSPPAPYGLHWFRRDLRVAGNPALQRNWKEHSGRVLGLFTFDAKFLSRPDFSINRFAFFLETLVVLREELRSLGGDLLVLDVGPREGFAQLMAALDQRQLPRPRWVTFNRDYEPFARRRDADLQTWIPQTFGIEVQTERDHLLIEPHEISKGDGDGFYAVYTPFSKRWFAALATDDVQQRIAAQRAGLDYLDQRLAGKPSPKLFRLTWSGLFGDSVPLVDQLERYRQSNLQKTTVPLPPAGSLAALTRLRQFLQNSATRYHDRRDFPAIDGTSQLSMFFKNGSLTAAQVLAELLAHRETLAFANLQVKSGPTVFVKEIAWREFYYHVLYHQPDVEQQAFFPRYRELAWENREDWFAAWKRGETGFPIVDAGMRQLRTTGWMHNRVRMIVASFLTKDLLIDWRWGEQYFMEQLLDGDLAPNNGGWQWAASTGCDPQPYFRIFNPQLQSEKFDPQGDYIRRFVPELADLSARQIHVPHAAGASKLKYPQPIVEHAVQREHALTLYRRLTTEERQLRDH